MRRGQRDETGQATSKVGRRYAETNHRALSQDSAFVDIQRIAYELSDHAGNDAVQRHGRQSGDHRVVLIVRDTRRQSASDCHPQ
jgi:hypothetical protein